MDRKNPYSKELNKFYNSSTTLWKGTTGKGPYELDWIGSDNAKEFDTFYNHSDLFRKHLEYYKEHPVKYKFNKQLFRNDFDFKIDKSRKVDLYLGSSNTVGVGSHPEHCFPYILGQKMGNDVINLGTGGYGIEASYLAIKRFVDYYDVQNVFHYDLLFTRHNTILTHKEVWTHDTAYIPAHNTIITKQNVHDSVISKKNAFEFSDKIKKVYQEDYIKNVLSDWSYIIHLYAKTLDAIKGICAQRDIKFYSLFSEPTRNFSLGTMHQHQPEEEDIISRDYSHKSYFNHIEIADKFYKITQECDGFIELDTDVKPIGLI